MTLRQKMLLKELPNNNYNISKTAKKVGYSKSYAEHDIHRNLVKSRSLKEFFSEDVFWKDYKRLRKELSKTKDYTNRLRLQELFSKILGMQVDKAEITQVDKTDNQFSLDRLSRISASENKPDVKTN